MTRSLFALALLIGAPSFAAPAATGASVWGPAEPMEKLPAAPCQLRVVAETNGQALWVELDKGQAACMAPFEAITSFVRWQAQPATARPEAPVKLGWDTATADAE